MNPDTRATYPVGMWMNAKICLPNDDRGFAIGKLVVDEDAEMMLMLTMDESLVQTVQGEAWQEMHMNAIESLANIPSESTILLAPPQSMGKRFWTARVLERVGREDEGDYGFFLYRLRQIRQLRNFLEGRQSNRVMFRTPVYLLEGPDGHKRSYFTRDISPRGLALVVEAGSQEDEFEIDNCYLLQLKIHESIDLPALNYRCMHKRDDLVTGSRIVGFSLEDSRAHDPQVEHTLTLLTWEDVEAS
jgi:hypothetical protein